MNIAPLPASGVPTHGATPPEERRERIDVRKLQMRTSATPGPRLAEAPPPALAISDETEQAPEASEASQPLSPQFAALAKQRRALQVKEREIADREKALAEKAGTQPAGIDVARLKSDPLGVLLEAGVTYEQLTEAVLASSGNAHEVSALKAEIQSLKSDFDKKLTDRDAQQEQQALAEMRREALQIVAQGQDFELVRETRSVPKAVELIEKTYRQTGEVLGVREALQLIEDELVKDSLRLAKLGKVQSQLAPPPAPQAQPQRQMRTLTNRDTAAVPLGRKERALAAALGQLKR